MSQKALIIINQNRTTILEHDMWKSQRFWISQIPITFCGVTKGLNNGIF